MYEQFPVRGKALGDASQQRTVVAHVLEHLDGNAAIVDTGGELEAVHIRGAYRDVLDAALCAARFDELALRPRVRYRFDACVGKPLGHEERQGAPAAAELEDTLSVLKLRALYIQLEHGLLGLIERLIAARIVRAGVLQARAQAGFEERRRQLVVLRVRRIGVDGDGTVAEERDALLKTRGLPLETPGALLGETRGAKAPDAVTDEGIGQEAALGPAEGAAARGRAGGEG
jgi:hypothetical protein